jgi:hypothetical protein
MSDEGLGAPAWARAKATPKNKPTWRAFAAAIFVTVIWSLASLPGLAKSLADITHESAGQTAEYQIGALIGGATGAMLANSLLIAGVVWAVAYFGFVRHSAPDRGARHFGTLLLIVGSINIAFAVLGWDAILHRVQDEKVAAREIGSTLRTLPEVAAGKQSLDTTVSAKGDAGKLEGIMKQWIGEIVDDRRGFEAELERDGYKTLMSPRELAADPGLRGTRAKLRHMRVIVSQYRGRLESRRAELRSRIQASSINPTMKQAVLAGVERSSAGTQAHLDEMASLDDRIVNELDEAVSVLQRAEGRWVVRGGKLLFVSRNDLFAYQSHVSQAQSAAAQERALQAQAINAVRQQASELEANAR